jgi:hypothetical protein
VERPWNIEGFIPPEAWEGDTPEGSLEVRLETLDRLRASDVEEVVVFTGLPPTQAAIVRDHVRE